MTTPTLICGAIWPGVMSEAWIRWACGGGGPGLRVFTPERVWHWPDLADPGTLAGDVRQAISTAASGEMPPGAS